jgi:glycosyltransferase involved in cell wall biosynthesis
MRKQNIFVVIPAFNEQPRLPAVLALVKKYFPLKQVVVVDDGSEIPLKISSVYPIWMLRHKINLGKGMAMRTGAEFAFSKGADAVIFIDADGQHDPREIPIFIEYFHQGFDLVFGSRRPSLNTPLVRYLGNKFASVYIRVLFGVYVSDILSGYRGLTAKAYRLLRWDSPRYGVETEMVARLGQHKHELRWVEFPIETIYKDKYKGVTLIQAVKILGESIWWKFT